MNPIRLCALIAQPDLWSRRPHTHDKFLRLLRDYPDFTGPTDTLWTISQFEQEWSKRSAKTQRVLSTCM